MKIVGLYIFKKLSKRKKMCEIKQYDVQLNWTKCGQLHAYGDTHRVCEIHTKEEIPENDLLLLVKNGSKMEKSKFDNTMKDMATYFRGYYTLQKTDYGYLYHAVEPYTD